MKTAVICVVTGLVIMYLFLQNTKMESSALSDIKEKEGQQVVVEGTVKEVNVLDKITYISLQRTETARVTILGPVPALTEGQRVQVRGKIETYEGKISILGEELRVIS